MSDVDIKEVQQRQDHDFQFMIGVIITTIIGLVGLIAKGVNWL